MDERTLNELLECSVCLERLDSNSKVLPCQHTFCRRCLEEIVCTKKELRCPECRAIVTVPIDELPANILLMRLLEGMKTASVLEGSNFSSPVHGAYAGTSLTTVANKAQSASQPCAKALYNYDANEPGDLSFKKGDIVNLRKQVDENWYHGELNGQHGFFPATYVQVLTALPQPVAPSLTETSQESSAPAPRCTALYDFAIGDKNEKDCLPFHKDDVMTVIRRVDENWAEGKLGERIGIFPISFVEMNESAKCLMEKQASPSNQPPNALPGSNAAAVPTTSSSTSSSSSSSESPPSSPLATVTTTAVTMTMSAVTMRPMLGNHAQRGQKRHSLTISSDSRISPPSSATVGHANRRSLEITSTVMNGVLTTTTLMSSSAVVTTAVMTVPKAVPRMSSSVAGGSSGGDGDKATPPHHVTIYKALYNYKPQKQDELELKKGEYYTVSEKHQDGWFKGTCLKQGTIGVFPGNYVQVLRIPSTSKSNGRVTLASRSGQPKTTMPHMGTAAASLIRPPNVTVTHTRTITNVTQAQTRSMLAAGVPSSIIARTPTTPSTSSTVHVTSSSNAAPMVTTANMRGRSSSAATTTSTSLSTVNTSRVTSPRVASPQHRASPTNSGSNSGSGTSSKSATTPAVHTANAMSVSAGASSDSSPRTSSRKSHHHHHHHKHSPRVAVASVAASNAAATAVATLQASMATNSSVTPPNVVIGNCGAVPVPSGATGSTLGGTASAKLAEKREQRKERERLGLDKLDKLGLMKRLSVVGVKGRKCKSPPPDGTSGSQPDSSNPRPTHQRTSSLPSASCDTSETSGAVAAATGAAAAGHSQAPAHKKSSAPTDCKPGKVKPLNRERFRCVVPYPPQSDLELELKVGDIVYVYKKREDGWFKGTLHRTGKTGLFPGMFVESF